MKVIKLDRRHTLYKDGFKFAFRGAWSTTKCAPIERYLSSIYGHHTYDRRSHWYSTFSNTKRIVSNGSGHSYKAKTYYIALRNEIDVTACLLAAGI